MLVGKNNNGQDMKAPSMEFKQTLARDLIAYMKPKLTKFIAQNFLAQWQNYKFREILKIFPKDAIFSYIDFFENFIMMIQNEI
jgi:hypothetical protein